MRVCGSAEVAVPHASWEGAVATSGGVSGGGCGGRDLAVGVAEVVGAQRGDDFFFVSVCGGVQEVGEDGVDDGVESEEVEVDVLGGVSGVHWVIEGLGVAVAEFFEPRVCGRVEDVHHEVVFMDEVVAVELESC